MSHNIETFVYAGEPAWHGLGKEILPDLTPEQVMKAAELDWTVRKVPATIDLNGEQVSINRSALVRSSDNRILSIVSDDWRITQNSEAFQFFHEFIMNGGMEMHTAGSLRNGELVFALAKIKESFDLFGGDTVDGYLLFTNPHMFGVSIDVRQTNVRVVCNNTLTMALNADTERWFKTSHRKAFDAEAAKQALGLAQNNLKEYKEAAEFLGSKRYNTASVTEYFNKIFPIYSSKDAYKQSKNAKAAMIALETQPGVEFAEGSWWQAYNAVTFMTNHILGRTDDNRVTSNFYGSGRQTNVNALNTALEFAKVA